MCNEFQPFRYYKQADEREKERGTAFQCAMKCVMRSLLLTFFYFGEKQRKPPNQKPNQFFFFSLTAFSGWGMSKTIGQSGSQTILCFDKQNLNINWFGELIVSKQRYKSGKKENGWLIIDLAQND